MRRRKVTSVLMSLKAEEEQVRGVLRRRLHLWTRYLRYKHRIASIRQMAEEMHLAGPTVNNVWNDATGAGIVFLKALRDRFKESADHMLDEDPGPIPQSWIDETLTKERRGPTTR
jgi:DNA-binding transcriptional regulator YhcF (GntR family)